ncbi:MAG: preprotein translocase subunit SecE [Myxococcales bacterium FL481]|nr:MAG: preprotein translocase subunit SecE [Myxococcales bacterium FL481]
MAGTRKRKSGTARELDPARWAHAIFAVGGFLAAWLMTNAVEAGWNLLFSYMPTVGRPIPYLANLGGVIVALVGIVVAWRNQRYFKFVTEVVVEVSQVTWPTRSETRAATGVVISITIICSVLLFLMDTVWSSATDWLYGL